MAAEQSTVSSSHNTDSEKMFVDKQKLGRSSIQQQRNWQQQQQTTGMAARIDKQQQSGGGKQQFQSLGRAIKEVSESEA